MSERIVLYGGSFNPPGLHHRQVIEDLAGRFDRAVVVPCGPRPDKDTTSDIEPVHRAAMADIAFRGLERVEVDLFDLEQATFTRTWDLDQRYRGRGEIWHAIGSDLIAGGAAGKSPIQAYWYRGEELWKSLRFVVYARPGHEIDRTDLPPNHEVVESHFAGASSETREAVFRRLPIAEQVTPEIASYLGRYRLYQGSLPQRATRLRLDEIRAELAIDEANPRARAMAESLAGIADDSAPNCIVVVGGDGTMLRAIRRHWRKRLPMIGLSAGHRGFLLNRPEDLLRDGLPRGGYIVQHLPLLYVEVDAPDGTSHRSFAFNDAWLERASAQTAWVEVTVDGTVRLPKLVCDGVLLATAAGSTAYARAMGATPMRVDTPELLLVGSNAMEPVSWKSAHLSLDAEVRFRGLDPDKRPLHAYADGVSLGEAMAVRLRKSHIAAVELAFTPERDLTTKLTEIQFPAMSDLALALAPAELEQAGEMLAAMEADTTRNLSFFSEPPTLARQQRFLGDMIDSAHDELFVVTEAGSARLIGTVGLHEIDRANGAARLGALIFRSADRGRGIGRRAIELAIEHAFQVLELNKVYLNVFAENARGQSLYCRMGFVAEGRLRREYRLDGTYHDLVRMALLRSEWPAGSSSGAVPSA